MSHVTPYQLENAFNKSDSLTSVAQLDACPTSGQEVMGLTPAKSVTFFRGDLIMKYFLQSFSPFG